MGLLLAAVGLIEHILPPFLRPRTKRQMPEGIFPVAGTFSSSSPDPVSEEVYEPFFVHWARQFVRLRVLHPGQTPGYLVYILVAVMFGLAWASARRWLGGG